MNYLAHLYLSGTNEGLLLGNFVADHLKGTDRKLPLPPDWQAGIALHRYIDRFTDAHPIVAESKARVRPFFGKYAPVIIDVFYDHFLAANWRQYHPQPLPQYAREAYALMYKHWDQLPSGARHMLPYMRQHDWLSGYAYHEGIVRVMAGMSRRTRFNSRLEQAPALLQTAYQAFEAEFKNFFPELERAVQQFLDPRRPDANL